MRISDWSSDVCSSDLPEILRLPTLLADPRRVARSIVTNFALCIELAGALRKIIAGRFACPTVDARSEEHTSELQSLMRISYAVFCLNTKKHKMNHKDRNADINVHLTGDVSAYNSQKT